VWLCHDGAWESFFLDDYIPTYLNNPIFSKAHNAEIWVPLLEKAYAKAFGSYAKIKSGFTSEAIKDLTGSPYKT
jgi:calpain-15